MTVKELKEILSKYDKEIEVCTETYLIYDIEKENISKKKFYEKDILVIGCL